MLRTPQRLDLGGGLDDSLVAIDGNDFQVVDSSGIERLGG
jgi:hypothetical protein